jgi:putative colanic acid biosynthesis UDP-glucose lipid carrier transferase
MLSKIQKRLYLISPRNNNRKLIFAGFSEETLKLRSYFIEKESKISVLGVFSNNQTDDPHILGTLKDLEYYATKNRIDFIFISLGQVNKDEYIRIVDFCEIQKIKLYVIPYENYIPSQNYRSIILNDILLFRLLNSPLEIPINKFIKRMFDLLFSIFVCAFILSWLFPIIALLIKLESKGPVFFIQKRNGVNNREFSCIKFRTLIVNDEADTMQVRKNDSRITKIGSFLRMTSLDEFPQFINVLLGNMSIVGPRPHMLKHNEYYNKVIYKYVFRHYVKPGITGLAQVLGYRGETESDIHLMKMRVRMDRFYIYNWSLWLDMKIIFKTFFEVLFPKKNTF